MSAGLAAFGAYDTRKPRVRLLLGALRRAGALEEEILIPAWEEVPETNVPSYGHVLRVLWRMFLGYPRAIWRLAQTSQETAILLPYPGIIEILLLAPIAQAMRRPIVLDAFLPIHDTVAGDRALIKRGVVTSIIWWFEKIALGRASLILVDTDAHRDYFAQEYDLKREKFITVLVGAEAGFTPEAVQDDTVEDVLGPLDDRPIVLFYGQLIPLHGLPTILEAAALTKGRDIRWVVIGRGQLEPMLRDALTRSEPNIEWIEWIDYERLPAVIARASLCLGVFGASDKAARVIPNKLFQQAAVGKPVITRSSPAVDPLAKRFPCSIITVPPGDAQALADAVAKALARKDELAALPEEAMRELSPDAGVAQLLARLDEPA
ncbi:glycosyltransferase [Erythrobacter sp. HL-111]|uniref:glycosyltransferase n=1 Tax=Erythrobacter sp. HL-111 TaxID=1798193 RepID=UPI0006D94D06|nr:glycosyltransferase [Erythrobacter sp. HL-111]KPP93424.1 MAG: Glycosyltransferase [Erythrobacteraceae bacterium HL-111]SDR69782.1 Glycosyltransferase involved in cell wall bisynthesis [Erythrobacter sp. HL-111]